MLNNFYFDSYQSNEYEPRVWVFRVFKLRLYFKTPPYLFTRHFLFHLVPKKYWSKYWDFERFLRNKKREFKLRTR